MLPELPFALVFYFVHIVMSNPVRIVVEDGSVEILLLEFIICIDYRLYMIPVFHDMKPCENVLLEILHALVFRLVLNIEHWREISRLERYVVEKEISLLTSRRVVAPKMISSSDIAIFQSLFEVILE